jgi:hypothetical protein
MAAWIQSDLVIRSRASTYESRFQGDDENQGILSIQERFALFDDHRLVCQ